MIVLAETSKQKGGYMNSITIYSTLKIQISRSPIFKFKVKQKHLLFQLHPYHIFALLAGFVCIHVVLRREPLIIRFFKIITLLFLS